MTKAKKQAQDEAREHLRRLRPPGTQINCIVSHVARSGMSRTIRAIVVRKGDTIDISWHVARALDWRYIDRHGTRGVHVTGCGMDMGFHGAKTEEITRPGGHTATRTPHFKARRGHFRAGYSLAHRWM